MRLIYFFKYSKQGFLFSVATLFLILLSCKSNDKKMNDATTELDGNHTQNASFTDPVFYKTLEGTIASKPVIMHFLKCNNTITANYYYVDKGEPIFLMQDFEKSNKDSIYLFEINNDATGVSPQLALFISEEGIKGKWENVDGKTYPILLKTAEQQATFNFSAVSASDSTTYLKFKADTPMLKSSVSLLVAKDKNADAEWLNKRIKNIVDNGNNQYAALTIPELVRAIVEDNKNNYKADVDSSTVGMSKTELENGHYFLNRDYATTSNIIYNSKNYVVLSLYNYAYTGGAHGMYGTSMNCFDIKNQKKLILKDILNIDSVTMQNLLDKNFKIKYNVHNDTPIEDILFVKHLAPNNNFYFTSAGLGFVYTPYEIASYAQGEINIWIPFSDFKNYLNPVFAKRIGM